MIDYDNDPVVLKALSDPTSLTEHEDRYVKWLMLEKVREGASVHLSMVSGQEIEKPRPVHIVYYVKFCCRIKIGTTIDLDSRLTGIPHDEVLATEPGDRKVEAERHEQFDHLRTVGEWFREGADLYAHIAVVRAGMAPRTGDRLVSSSDAMLYTGRDRQTLYRWAIEGRITKHPGGKWDIWELPPHVPGEPHPTPPPKRG